MVEAEVVSDLVANDDEARRPLDIGEWVADVAQAEPAARQRIDDVQLAAVGIGVGVSVGVAATNCRR